MSEQTNHNRQICSRSSKSEHESWETRGKEIKKAIDITYPYLLWPSRPFFITDKTLILPKSLALLSNYFFIMEDPQLSSSVISLCHIYNVPCLSSLSLHLPLFCSQPPTSSWLIFLIPRWTDEVVNMILFDSFTPHHFTQIECVHN